MTSHELAKKLLNLPDLPVVTDVTSGYDGSSDFYEIIRVIDSRRIREWVDAKGVDRRTDKNPCLIITDSIDI